MKSSKRDKHHECQNECQYPTNAPIKHIQNKRLLGDLIPATQGNLGRFPAMYPHFRHHLCHGNCCSSRSRSPPSGLVESPPMHYDTLCPDDLIPSLHDCCALPRNVPCHYPFLNLSLVEDASPCVLEHQRCADTFCNWEESGAKEGEGSGCGIGVENARFGTWRDNVDCSC